jgi:Spy/CpxP family protein refolding chaperone
MKFVRIATLTGILSIGLASVAAAQGSEQGQTQSAGRREMGGTLLKDITLTDAQKDQVKTIREKYLPQQQEIRKAAQGTGTYDDATRAKVQDLQSKQAAEIRAILTPDQQAIFDKNLAAIRDRQARKPGS